MLRARRQDDDVASRVMFHALVGSALAIPLENDDHLLGLVKVPWHDHPWTDDVFMYVRLRAQRLVGDEIPNPALWATRNFAKYCTENCHDCPPEVGRESRA